MRIENLGLEDEVSRGLLEAASPRGTLEWTPLQYACAIGDEELVRHILEDDPAMLDSTGKTKFSYSPLHIAVRYEHMDIVDVLLSHGSARVLVEDDMIGATPLHLAVMQGNLALVQKLLPGVTTSIPTTKRGTTPYQIAKRLGHIEISRMLQNHDQRLTNQQLVRDWLASIGLLEYAPRMLAQGFDDLHLLLMHELSDAALDAMQIDKPGHRLKLQTRFQLREFLDIASADGDQDGADNDNTTRANVDSGDDDSDQPLQEDSSRPGSDSDSDGNDDNDEEEEETNGSQVASV